MIPSSVSARRLSRLSQSALPRTRLIASCVLAMLVLGACGTRGASQTTAATISGRLIPASTDAPATSPPPHDPRLHAASTARTQLPSPVIVPLDPAVLAQLPRQPVSATAHGKTLRCEGIALATLLRIADAMPDEPLKGAQLTRYVQVEARDGYRVVFALAELDPTLGNNPVFVVDHCEGKPLANDDGPLRLIAPNEVRQARSVRQLKSITVIVAP